jgi:60 kDa SS-A/Ro ribonucleoprotein
MKVNVRQSIFTHGDAPAAQVSPLAQLRRTILACMLFEDNFYESGVKAVDRIVELCKQVDRQKILGLAFDAAKKYHLRHIPLLMIVEALKKIEEDKDYKNEASHVIHEIITRPDMMTDLLALYWRDGKKPLAHQLMKGLAKAFRKFDEYQLSKWNKDGAVKLRDVLFLCHAKPKDAEQDALWKRLIANKLKIADTWETRLSAGEDKKESFNELLKNHKMGKLAILRNMRNMIQANVPKELVASELHRNPKEMLPFQYLAAARECPQWEDIIDSAMIQACSLKPKILGKTCLLVDVSGSMRDPISAKSTMTRMDAACGLAILLRECIDDIYIATFSNNLATLPPRHGMALRDVIITSQPHGGTMMGAAVNVIIKSDINWDRIIIITDEQSNDVLPQMKKGNNYILNIAGYQNGVGNLNRWTTITGFSEASIDYIREFEALDVK